MHNTIRILESLRTTTSSGSDYSVAQSLGIPRQTVSGWVNEGKVMSEKIAIRAAKQLNLRPEYVLACLQAERSINVDNTEAGIIWKRIASAFYISQAAVLTVFIFNAGAGYQSFFSGSAVFL